jgi:serine/threonine protein kinase
VNDNDQTLMMPDGATGRVTLGITVPGYEVHSVLGRGGMGVVYHAKQIQANRDVALKMILSGEHAGSLEIARFKTEALAVARLQHPNIVTVYEVGEHEGRPFFSMEFCPGGSLASQRGSLSPRAAAELLMHISRGMGAAHAAGVVHRDLKPGNVLLTAEGVPKISDFGLAKQLVPVVATPGETVVPQSDLTASGAMLGTPSYMAPEQAGEARQVGPTADVYSLGAILYDLLTGRPPFRGATPTETLLQLLNEDPSPPRDLNPGLPRDLEAICLRCLDKNPARRYATASELADDLQRFLEGDPVSAVRHGFVTRLAGSLERVQLHEKFAVYGSLLLALAPVMFLPEIWITLVTWNRWPSWCLPIGQFGRAITFLGVVGYYRGWRWLPQGSAERQVWSVWGGYILSCFIFGLSSRVALGDDVELELRFYQPLACLTALAFFAVSPNLWGYCLVIGEGFLGLSFVMALNLHYAPLEFGAAWAIVLIAMGLRLRKIAKRG